MGKIGFGSYRISINSKEHELALINALKAGVSLIDTSANYTNGESEQLIGKVLDENPEFKPTLVTKAGYLQGKNLFEDFEKEEVVDISDILKHSIHPNFLKDQLNQSLKRLKKEYIDVFLLHNPEYYFKSKNSGHVAFYKRIKKAFEFLEFEVSNGRIKSYGISSNNFILPHNDPEYVNLEVIINIAKSISKNHHFTHIQFPLNLIEVGALEKLGEYGEISLVEQAKFNNLIVMINRPLNAFSDNNLIRLASYTDLVKNIDDQKANLKFQECLEILNKKWIEEQLKEDETDKSDIYSITLIKQFKEVWNCLPTPDAVEQIYFGHLFPFIANVWGKNLTSEESRPFYDLYEISELYSRKMLDLKAQKFREQAINVGLIQEISSQNFAKEVIETYLNYGIDYVLVGMRKPEYVDQLKSFF
jgi:predicted aldo/keto reductase-like oxidoreductase